MKMRRRKQTVVAELFNKNNRALLLGLVEQLLILKMIFGDRDTFAFKAAPQRFAVDIMSSRRGFVIWRRFRL